jgi:hypothetical protein
VGWAAAGHHTTVAAGVEGPIAAAAAAEERPMAGFGEGEGPGGDMDWAGIAGRGEHSPARRDSSAAARVTAASL